MKFYDCKTAPSPRRVRIFLAEKGVELPTVQVDLGSGEQFSEEFRKINPDCAVPVLELDDGRRISEVSAICHYLEERFPEPALIGTNPEQRAEVLMWNAKVEQQGLMAMAEAFRNASKALANNALPGPDHYGQIPELAERGRQRVGKFFEKLDGELANSRFVAGDFYSLADISATVTVDFAAWIKLSVPDDAGHLHRWYKEVSKRPSASA